MKKLKLDAEIPDGLNIFASVAIADAGTPVSRITTNKFTHCPAEAVSPVKVAMYAAAPLLILVLGTQFPNPSPNEITANPLFADPNAVLLFDTIVLVPRVSALTQASIVIAVTVENSEGVLPAIK
jgi:hypothetical protein